MNKLFSKKIMALLLTFFLFLFTASGYVFSQDNQSEGISNPFGKYRGVDASLKPDETSENEAEKALRANDQTALPSVSKGFWSGISNGLVDIAISKSQWDALLKAFKDDFNIDVSTLDGSTYKASTLVNIYDWLAKMPASFRGCVNMIQKISVPRNENFGKVNPENVAGYVKWEENKTVYMTDRSENNNSNKPESVFIHEMGHCFHMQNTQIMDQWQDAFWGPRNAYTGQASLKDFEKPVSEYGHTNAHEDFSEAIMYYILEPSKLKGQTPSRYQFIKDKVMQGYEF